MGYTVVLRDWQGETIIKRHFDTHNIAAAVARNWANDAYERYEVELYEESDSGDWPTLLEYWS